MSDNVMLITIEGLKTCIPKEWTSFSSLVAGIKEGAGKKCVAESPFWLLTDKALQDKCVLATAMLEVKDKKGNDLYCWVIDALGALGSKDITELPDIMDRCPDQSILPLI